MRTTIEIKPEHRAKLLELAARRGEKGFSSVIAEALEGYLVADQETESLRRRALRRRGVFSKIEVERLRRDTATIREHWR